MNLSSASNGPIVPHYTPYIPTLLPPQQPGPFSHDASQADSWDVHSDNPQYPEFFHNADSFSASAFSPFFNAPQAFAPGGDPFHPSYINGQSPSGVLGTTSIPLPQPRHGLSQYMPTNQSLEATCSCSTSVAHRTGFLTQFGGRQPALANQDPMAPSTQASPSSSRRGRTAPSPYARPPVLHTPMQYPGVIDVGSALPTSDTGCTRRSKRLSVIRNRRRTREIPLVRVEDRIEWVRHDLLKMTLLFNWSPDAEAKAHEPWGEVPRVVSSVDEVALLSAASSAPNVPPLPGLR